MTIAQLEDITMPYLSAMTLSPSVAEVPPNTTGAHLWGWLTDGATQLFVPALGAMTAVVLGFIGVVAFRVVASKSRILKAWVRRTTLSFLTALATWGAWLALIFHDLWTASAAPTEDLIGGAATEARNMSAYQHLFLIAAIAATTWFVYTWLWVLEDAAKMRAQADGEVSSRFVTQAQVLRRLGQVVIWVVGIAFIIFTFPGARQFMGGLLASAGLVSVIAGLAAQSTLSNVFAGLQLAFTDAIRVGDTVMVGPKDQTGQIEEITLAYVVVRVWDQRRIVVPSSTFTNSIFENWTRRETQQQGTIELRLDWGAPMAQIRQKVASLLASTDLWDGRSWAVHVTDSDKDTILVRIVVSARNSSELFELRSFVRERLIDWVMTEEPWVRPALLLRQQEVEFVTHDSNGEELARLAAELSGIAADTTHVGNGATPPPSFQPGSAMRSTRDEASHASSAGQGAANPTEGTNVPVDHAHTARLTASRQKAKKARRRAMAERQRELAEGGKIAGEAEGNPDDLATKVMTAITQQEAQN